MKRLLLGALFLAMSGEAFADSTTTNYGWAYPTVNADAATWGTTINSTIIAIDAQMALMAPLATPTFSGTVNGAALNFSGNGAIGGTLLVSGVTTLTQTEVVTGSAGTARAVNFDTGAALRWGMGANSDTEAGSNAGSNFQIGRFSDAGSLIDIPFVINRANGQLTVTQTIQGNISGNAGTATALASGGTIGISGDLTYTSPAFTGSNVTASGTLATVNSNVGTYTNATVTVNAKGLVTAASSGTNAVTAWADVSCTSGGCTVNGSSNVSSVTRSAAGNYTVNYTSNYADTHYAAQITPVYGAGACVIDYVTSKAIGSTQINLFNLSGTGADCGFEFVVAGT